MPKAGFRISIFPQNVALIRFAGTLDATVITRAVEECLNRKCYSVVMDLAEVGHCPSQAVGAFLGLKPSLDQLNGRMVFVEVDGGVKIVFDLMGMREIFRFFPDLDQALREMIDMGGNTRHVSL